MGEESFKLPGSSYGELAKIIRAYGHAGDDASPKDVADRAGIDPTQVSRNNAFLLAVGIVEGGNKKRLTTRGRALAQAMEFEIPDKVSEAWRAIVTENEFLRKVVSAVQIRGGMEPSSLRSHVAYTAGVAKKPASMTGAGTIIDVLLGAGILREEDGRLVAAPESDATVHDSGGEVEPLTEGKTPTAVVAVAAGSAAISTSVQIQVRVDCSPEQLELLGAQLKSLLDGLRQTGEADRGEG